MMKKHETSSTLSSICIRRIILCFSACVYLLLLFTLPRLGQAKVLTPVIPPTPLTNPPSVIATPTPNVALTAPPTISDAEATIKAARISAAVALFSALTTIAVAVVSSLIQSRNFNQQLEAQRQQFETELELKKNGFNELYRQFEKEFNLEQQKLDREYPQAMGEIALEFLRGQRPVLTAPNEVIGTPYTVGPPVSPQNFIGRRELVNEIYVRLQSSQVMSSSIVGLTRSGKTSLLYYLGDQATKRNRMGESAKSYFLCYLDLQANIDSPRAFYQRMLETLIKTIAQQRAIAFPKLLDGPVDYGDVENLLDETTKLGMKIVFMIDEFDRVVGTFDTDFLEGLRAFIQPNRDFAWILASRESLIKIGRRVGVPHGSDYYNIFTPPPLYVGAMTPSEARNLILRPIPEFHSTFSEGDIKFLTSLAGRLPFPLQLASALLYKRQDKSRDETRLSVRSEFLGHMDRYYRKYWKEQLFYEQKQMLREIATSTHQVVIDEQLTNAASSLHRLGILEFADEWQISSEGFREWITKNHTE